MKALFFLWRDVASIKEILQFSIFWLLVIFTLCQQNLQQSQIKVYFEISLLFMKEYRVCFLLLSHLGLVAFATLVKSSPHSQLRKTASWWVQFECFFPHSSFAQQRTNGLVGSLPWLFKKKVRKINSEKSSFFYFSTSRNLKKSEHWCYFLAPLQFLIHYLRKWLKNAIRHNKCELHILRYHHQCQADQENTCFLCLCVYVLSKDLEKNILFTVLVLNFFVFTQVGPFQV